MSHITSNGNLATKEHCNGFIKKAYTIEILL